MDWFQECFLQRDQIPDQCKAGDTLSEDTLLCYICVSLHLKLLVSDKPSGCIFSFICQFLAFTVFFVTFSPPLTCSSLSSHFCMFFCFFLQSALKCKDKFSNIAYKQKPSLHGVACRMRFSKHIEEVSLWSLLNRNILLTALMHWESAVEKEVIYFKKSWNFEPSGS